MIETVARFENDFLYVIFQRPSADVADRLLYCAGVNILRFRPLTRGKHGNASNPSYRGLQLLRLRLLVPEVLARGGRAERICGDHCEPVPVGDGWFSESMELHGVGPDFGRELLPRCVRTLVELILGVCFPGRKIPDDIYEPARLARYLDGLA